MAEKKRLDIYLTEENYFDSREKARAAVMAGQVFVNSQKALKPGDTVKPDDKIEVRGGSEFVSRGGHKLKKAVQVFTLDLKDKICMDIGASTGGFTDCMLQNGAKKVYAVDVGYGQLAWKLRNDERVVNLERTNIRYLTKEQVSEKLDFASVDVAFISLKLVLPVAYEFLSETGECVCLIKPQFEAGRERVGKKGVVREKNTHIEVVKNICDFAAEIGFIIRGLDFSPIKGPEGNIEYLLYIAKGEGESIVFSPESVVESSHACLDK
ncbi:MAG: TlyA family RNA methyltransferase [Oscillospiraceae bacterium]|nr:TlyA family RNA methyltransferase [Oscillospiraceae bacterium]